MTEPVQAPVRENDPREPDLQGQVQDIRLALEEWRRTRTYSQATEQRLAKITVQCARMVETWQQIEQRRSVGLAGLERGGNGADADAPHESAVGENLRALEHTIEHEWEALPEGDERAMLAESCVAAAELTLRGFARAESRLASLERDLHGRMEQLSHDLQAVVTELRSARPQALPGAAPAFPLESVMRIHEELRDSDPAAPAAGALKAAPARALPQAADAGPALAARIETLERAAEKADVAPQRAGWQPLHTALTLLVALAAFAVFAFWMQRRVDEKLSEAAARVATAERQTEETTAAARQEAAATREEAARQVADARQSATQAQIVGNVLAAPDLLRYWLVGVEAGSRAYAQVLFSRSRGIVFSASRLPAPGDGKAYQLWLLTRTGPVSAGVLTPDNEGRVTFTTDAPLGVQGRVASVLVTLEPVRGAAQPSAARVLVRTETAAQ